MRPDAAEAIFDEVVELPAAERPTALARLCQGDAALQATVQRLLDADAAQPADFLERGALGVDPKAPSVVGRFQLGERLGAGGMGVVFRARDAQLGRDVALKLLSPDVVAPEAAARLAREAQALARVAHPNVVPVYEAGQADGRVYLVMELVQGQTLRAHLQGRGASVEQVVRLFLEAGRGLAAAHEAGLVHRDFKPENVLVGVDGRVRVVDFGLALEPDGGGEAAAAGRGPRVTQTGQLLGTLAYMAPEQLAGLPATQASDQFSFCLALWEAVAGAPAFRGDAPAERRAAVDGGPPRAVGLPRWLDAALRKGLAPKPGARFASMDALLGALEAGLPHEAARTGLGQRAVVMGLITAASLVLFSLTRRFGLPPPWALAGLALVPLLFVGVATAVMWRALSRAPMNRRFALMLTAMLGGQVLHRAVNAAAGIPAERTLPGDLALLSCACAVAALVSDRLLAWSAIVLGVGAVVAASQPQWAGQVYFTCANLSLAGLVVAWRRA